MTPPPVSDVFEDVLNLESQYYQEGYDLGVADGSQSGRIEGRLFGLQKGFEKFLEMGTLHGRASVWEARLARKSAQGAESADGAGDDAAANLPGLPDRGRLRKHVERLAALSDPDGLRAENSEDAVSEFDDRLKDAKAKLTLVSRIVGEVEGDDSEHQKGEAFKENTLRVKRNGPDGGGSTKRTSEMEDFSPMRRNN